MVYDIIIDNIINVNEALFSATMTKTILLQMNFIDWIKSINQLKYAIWVMTSMSLWQKIEWRKASGDH